MISRKYTKAISLYKTTNVSDGYGGFTVSESLYHSCWANVENKKAYRTNENGQNDNFIQTKFTIRNKCCLDISIKDTSIRYKGLIFNIDSIENVDFNGIDLEIYATQRD